MAVKIMGDRLDQARERFSSLSFHLGDYREPIPPTNNRSEIKRIRAKLAKLDKNDIKGKALLEALLEEQTKGQLETLDAYKDYESFKSMKWTSDKKPFMKGVFRANDSNYILTFTARIPDEITDTKYFFTHVGLGLESRNALPHTMIRKIDPQVQYLRGYQKMFVPPFTIATSSTDLGEAHERLWDVLDKLGWRKPVQYKAPKQ